METLQGTAQTRGEDGEGQTAGDVHLPRGGAHRATPGVSAALLWQALAQFEVSKQLVTIFCISVLPSEVSSGVRERSRGRELIKASQQGAHSPSTHPALPGAPGEEEPRWGRGRGHLVPSDLTTQLLCQIFAAQELLHGGEGCLECLFAGSAQPGPKEQPART